MTSSVSVATRIEKRLISLNEQSFGNADTGFYDSLHQANSLGHDVLELGGGAPSSEISACASLLFGEFAYNALGFLKTSSEMPTAVDFQETRNALYKALTQFITIAQGSIMRDYVGKIRRVVLDALQREKSSTAKVEALKPLQAVLGLDSLELEKSIDFDSSETAHRLLATFKGGKLQNGYTAQAMGEILITLGMLCAKCPQTFQAKERGAGPLIRETMGQALIRLILVKLENSSALTNQRGIQAGSFCALRYALVGCPPESKETCQIIYNHTKIYMVLPKGKESVNVCLQAMFLLLWHSNLLAPSFIAEADVLFDRFVEASHAQNQRLSKLGFSASCAVLKTIAAYLEDEDERLVFDEDFHDDQDDSLEGGGGPGVEEQNEQDDDDAFIDMQSSTDSAARTSQTLAFVNGKRHWQTIEIEARRKILGLFMVKFRVYLECRLLPRSSDKDERKKRRKQSEIAMHGYGLFAPAIAFLHSVEKLRGVLLKLFELDDRANQAEEEEESATVHEKKYFHADRAARKIRFLLAFARIVTQLPAPVIGEEIIMNRVCGAVYSLGMEFMHFSDINRNKFSFAVLTLFTGLADKAGCLSTVLSKSMQPLFLVSVVSVFSPQNDQPPVFVFESFWKKIFPAHEDWAIDETLVESLVPASQEAAPSAPLDLFVTSATTFSAKIPRASARKDAKRQVFDEFMRVVLNIIPKLNLECTLVETNIMDPEFDSSSLDPLSSTATTSSRFEDDYGQDANHKSALMVYSTDHIVPNALDDLKMLHDVTNLLCALLPVVSIVRFVCWIPLYAKVCQQGAEANPLISCWYRLMSLAFRALDKLFAGSSGRVAVMDAQTLTCMSSFIETTVLRSRQYTDELLAAALTCVLNSPRGSLLNDHLKILIPCLVSALNMGLSHQETADLAITQTERWIVDVPSELLGPYFPAILPEVGKYLSTSSSFSLLATTRAIEEDDIGEDDANTAAAFTARSVPPLPADDLYANIQAMQDAEVVAEEQDQKSRTKAIRVTSSSRGIFAAAGQRTLKIRRVRDHQLQLQLRAAHVLGRVGGQNKHVLPPLQDVLEQARLWDTVPRLEIQLPLGDFQLKIYIDSVLPRIVHLARYSTQRQVKVAACELLHSIVLIMIGSSAFSPGPTSYVNLYRRLFPELFYLAVDVEPIARQLFNPLVSQCTRWFARNAGGDNDDDASMENPETSELLDACIEALGDKSNGSVRELGAQTIAIFFRWTFKSAGSGAVAGSSSSKRLKSSFTKINVDGLFRRLYALMKHPDPYKRLGSTLAFNAIYRDFREESQIVDENILQLLENAFMCLQLSHEDLPALGTVDSASDTLLRLLRIVTFYASTLAKQNEARKGFGDLNDAVVWLFSLCSSSKSTVRVRAQEFFEVLCVRGLNLKLNAWIEENRMPVRFDELVARARLFLVDENGVDKSPSYEDLERALNECSAVIDYRWWLARRQAVPLVEKDVQDVRQLVDKVCTSIVSRVTSSKRVAAAAAATTTSRTSTSTLNERKSWISPRAASFIPVFARLSIQFFVYAFKTWSPETTSVDCLIGLIVLVLIKPADVGLDADDLEVKATLPSAFQTLIRVDPTAMTQKASKLLTYIFTKLKTLPLSQLNLSSARLDLLCVIRTLLFLNRSGMDLHESDPAFDLNKLAQAICSLPGGSLPQTLRVASAALRLSFQLNWSTDALVKALLDVSATLTSQLSGGSGSIAAITSTTPPKTTATPPATNTMGATFFLHFQDEILARLLTRDDEQEATNAWSMLFTALDPGNLLGNPRSAQALQVISRACERFVDPTPDLVNRTTSQKSLVRFALVRLPCFATKITSHDGVTFVSKILQTFCPMQASFGEDENATFANLAVDTFRAVLSPSTVANALTKDATFAAFAVRLCLPPLLRGGVRDARGENGFFVSGKSIIHPVVLCPLETKSIDVVEKLVVANVFPLQLVSLIDPVRIKNYHLVLDALLSVLERTGSIALLRALYRVFREGELQIHAERISASLGVLAHRSDVSDVDFGCVALLGECMRSLMGKEVFASEAAFENVNRSKLILFEYLLLPLMSRLSSNGWESFMARKSSIVGNTCVMDFLSANALKEKSNDSKQCAYIAFRGFYEFATLDAVVNCQKLAFPQNQGGNECNKIVSALAKRTLAELTTNALVEKKVLETGQGELTLGASAETYVLCKALKKDEKFGNAVYACLVALVCKTQGDIRFFDLLAFNNKSVDIWHALVPMRMGPSTEPRFEATPPSSTKNARIVMLGFANTINKLPSRLESDTASRFESSQIMRSSLALGGEDDDRVENEQSTAQIQDADSHIDRLLGRDLKKSFLLKSTTMTPNLPAYVATDEPYIRDEFTLLPLDAINALPAMTSLLTALDCVRAKRLLVFDNADSGWVQVILGAINDKRAKDDVRQSINVRLFGLKVVLNRPTLFSSHAKLFLVPILRLMLDLESPFLNSFSSRGFTYLLKDVILMLYAWNNRKPDCIRVAEDDLNGRQVVSWFLNLLIRSMTTTTGSIVSESSVPVAQVLSTAGKLASFTYLIKSWKSLFELDQTVLLDLCSFADAASKDITGLSILNQCVKEGNVSFAPESQYANQLMDNLLKKISATYRSKSSLAAQVVGRYLLAWKPISSKEWYDGVVGKVRFAIENLADDKSKNRMLDCLATIARLGVVEVFTPRLVDNVVLLISNAEGEFLKMAIDIVSSAASLLPQTTAMMPILPPDDLYRKSFPVFISLLNMDNSHISSLLAGLQLAERLIQHGGGGAVTSSNVTLGSCLPLTRMKNDGWFYPVLGLALEHSSSRVRYSALMLVMWTLQHHPEVKNDVKFGNKLKSVLLFGMSDANAKIQTKLFAFWSDRDAFPERSPAERVARCISDLVPISDLVKTPEIRMRVQSHWASHVAQLLLALARTSSEYNDASRSLLFEKPLSSNAAQGSFFKMQTNASASSGTMAPLFLSPSQTMDGGDGGAAISSSSQGKGYASQLLYAASSSDVGGGGYVRATQAPFAFAPTQQTRSDGNIGGAPGGYVGTQALDMFSREDASSEKTMMLAPSAPGFRRFNAAVAAATPRASNVVVLRRYRKGELPDIQIPRRDLLEPLIELCGLDSEVAQNVLVPTFKAIVSRASEGLRDNFLKTPFSDYLRQVLNDLKTLLEKSRSNDASFVSCVLSLAQTVSEQAMQHGFVVELDPDVVGQFSRASLSLAAGVTSVEGFLLRHRGIENAVRAAVTAQPTKRAKCNEEEETNRITPKIVDNAWRQLFALYESLNENDVLLGLAERSCHLSSTKTALRSEFEGYHALAAEKYEDTLAVSVGVNEDEQLVAWTGRIRSLAALQAWNDVWVETKRFIELDLEPPFVEDIVNEMLIKRGNPFLSSFVLSGLRLGEAPINRVLSLAKDALGNDEHRAVLEASCAADLIHVELRRPQGPEWGRAQDRSNRLMDKFLRDWAAQSPLASSTRSRMMQPLQDLVGFLDFFEARRKSVISTTSKIDLLMDQWRVNKPSLVLDGVDVWESVMTKRTDCLLLLAKDEPFKSNSDFLTRVDSFSRDALVSFADAARLQGAFDVCAAVTKRLKSNQSTMANQELAKFAQIDLLLADKRTKTAFGGNRLDELKHFADWLVVPFTGGAADGVLERKKRLAFVSSELCTLLLNSPASQQGGGDDAANGDLCKTYETLAFQNFELVTAGTVQQSIRCQAHYEFGMFADHLNDRTPRSEFAQLAVRNVLTAIGLGSEAALNTFPKVLKLACMDAEDSNVASAFATGVIALPNASLLKWTAQLLSYVDRSPIVQEPLLRIAKAFPQSFVYPYRVAKESLEELGVKRTETGVVLEKLSSAMNLPPVVDLFCASLENLAHPHLRLRGYLTLALRCLGSSSDNTKKAERIWNEEIFGEFLNPNHLDSKVIGSYNRKFAQHYKTKFAELSLSSKSLDGMIKTIDKDFFYTSKDPLFKEMPRDKVSMSLFSTWLDSFVGLNRSIIGDLEIPGWRDAWHGGQGGATVEDNRVRAFDSTLLVMSSLRKPKRLTIGGSDDRRHMFLVKSGEDLRLDERIEQLFGFMNRLMSLDTGCSTRNLKVETYRVIPVSLSCGLIEWVPNSSPIRAIVESQFTLSNKDIISLDKWPATNTWGNFFTSKQRSYETLYDTPDIECAELYQVISDQIPPDLLRKHFLGMATGPDAFLALRKVFSQSLASLSMCSYVLGIGDRHLENFLLGATGQLIAIDFGYSFGVGVTLLDVPETTPFRLSRQFSEFLAPLNTGGLWFHSAARTMTCLRENRTKLLQVMDVFINEPLMDWISHAENRATSALRQAAATASKSAADKEWQWLAQSLVDVADMKMRGIRPSLVMAAELRERRKKPIESAVNAVCRAAKVNPESFKGVKLVDAKKWAGPGKEVSVHDQVAELVLMATDGSILVRQFIGSKSFV